MIVRMSSEEHTAETAWPGGIAAITLFVEDLEAAKRFYGDVFQLPVAFEDGNCCGRARRRA